MATFGIYVRFQECNPCNFHEGSSLSSWGHELCVLRTNQSRWEVVMKPPQLHQKVLLHRKKHHLFVLDFSFVNSTSYKMMNENKQKTFPPLPPPKKLPCPCFIHRQKWRWLLLSKTPKKNNRSIDMKMISQ